MIDPIFKISYLATIILVAAELILENNFTLILLIVSAIVAITSFFLEGERTTEPKS